ncbi:helicase HerA-like domain-containing protein [Leucobacter massiliensis]|uniref:ATPase n=1 Tax=Leucobacter massiliensis TaxID=1686285 RepID=A0A2S9QQ47_9MICO|nr:helicase HerA-like domain-containing protein [Leucobacter massiliensis]PRI11721.1 ATPase [Leucobacter massiliensis]
MGAKSQPDDGNAAVSAAEAAEAARLAQEELQAAIAKAEAAARAAAEAAAREAAASGEAPAAAPAAMDAGPAADAEPAPAAPETAESAGPAGPLSEEEVAVIRAGYPAAVDGGPTLLHVGALVNGGPRADAQITIPISMLNRHGLIAGATGTGKTRTLQGLAEQIAANGVPVFAVDIKGDLSGMAAPGEPNEKLLGRTAGIGQDWQPHATQAEFLTLGGMGVGAPIRTSIERFGPVMLSKVLGLNPTQESSLGLVFHYAKERGLPLIELADLQALLAYLTGEEGKAEIAAIGGLSKQTVGVIQRNVIAFAGQGADVFFGEPAFDPLDLLRTAPDGTGMVTLLEVPGVQDRPTLFSTFVMYLLAELFDTLPEVGDQDKPRLVFFFDEAHLLFADASKAFLQQITQTVRLIRSKGVGVFFVTQTPKDVPGDVLAQLGSRVQHALRAHTPDDAKALKATVSTYPKSGYDLAEVLQAMGTGEAIVTVMGENGAPTPVAWTRLRAPQGSMEPLPAVSMQAAVLASPLRAKYGEAIDEHSAAEMLAERAEEAAAERAQAEAEAERQRQLAAEAKQAEKAAIAAAKQAEREAAAAQRKREQEAARKERERNAAAKKAADRLSSVVTSGARTVVNQLLRSLFRR